MTEPSGLEERLAIIHHAFDQAYAVAPPTTIETFVELLTIRVAGDPYALRMREITGLVASRKIVPLPSRRPELLGVAGNRGSLVPVYSLAVLLGYERSSGPTPWLALVGRGSDAIALGFEALEGFLRVRSADVYAVPGAEPKSGPSREVVRTGDQSRRIVEVTSMVATLAVHTGAAGPPRES